MLVPKIIEWYGCYGLDWTEMICDDAMKHPAKFQHGLINRIVDYGIEMGFWSAGDLILDPFGGVACGGIICAYKKVRWIGIELEKRFCLMAKKNFKIHNHIWKHWGNPMPTIIHGDSTQLPVRRVFKGVITSPPFGELIKGAGLSQEFSGKEGYNITVGKIGSAYVTDLQATDKRNIALLKDNEYYAACKTIYKNCHDVLLPNGIMAVIVKDYIKEGKTVPVCDNSHAVIEDSGFDVFVRAHGMMVSSVQQRGLFQDIIVEKKEHKGFFRQLQEKKGAPPIDFEEIIFAKRK